MYAGACLSDVSWATLKLPREICLEDFNQYTAKEGACLGDQRWHLLVGLLQSLQ